MLRCSKGIEIVSLPNYMIMVICFAGTCLFWIAFDFVRGLPVHKFVKYSFMNYAMHKSIQQFFNKIIAKLLPPSLLGYFINLYGGCLFTVGIIVIFVKIISKVFPRMLEFLNGGREIS